MWPRAYVTLPVQMRAFKRFSGLGYRQVWEAIAPALLMALVMAGGLLALAHFIGDQFHHRGVFLLTMVLAGSALYAASLLLFARKFVLEQIRDLARLRPSQVR